MAESSPAHARFATWTAAVIQALVVFTALAVMLIASASLLAHAADHIADATGIGRVWIGTILLAGATSLPELATDIAAVKIGAADLAAGDLFGSSMANMLVFAVVGLFLGRLTPPGRDAEVVSLAALAMLLNACAALFVMIRPTSLLFGVAPQSLLLGAIYCAGMYALYRSGVRSTRIAAVTTATSQRTRLYPALLQFSLAAAALLVIGKPFAESAVRLAELSGLGVTLVGTLLVGVSTSLPELVTSIAAFRMGSSGLAVGNLFGSNAVNMVVFLAMDLADRKGPIFAELDPSHSAIGLFAVMLMAIAAAVAVAPASRRATLGRWLIVATYLLGVLWLQRSGSA